MKLDELLVARWINEGTVTQLKKMRDLSTGKDVMVNTNKAKPISLLAAFGGEELQVLHDMGLKTLEKPGYWSELAEPDTYGYRPWKELDIRRAEKTLGKKFPRVKASEIFGSDTKPKGPLKNFVKKPSWDHGIVEFDDGDSYFIDTTQASSYARMWAKVE